MKRIWPLLLLVATCVSAGCSRKSDFQHGLDTSKLERTFKSTDPDKSSRVALIVASFKTNDYTPGILRLRDLAKEPGLTPEQKRTAQELMFKAEQALVEAADKGDSNAATAIEDLRKARGR